MVGSHITTRGWASGVEKLRRSVCCCAAVRTVERLEERGLKGLRGVEELEAEEDEDGRLQELHQLVHLLCVRVFGSSCAN